MSKDVINFLVDIVEAVGAAMIVAGIAVTLFRVLRVPFLERRPPLAVMQIRLGLGMFLALGLEFLLAADILRTAVAPTWKDIGQLAAIASIRTGLNYFLGREFIVGEHEIAALESARLDARTAGPPGRPPAHPAPAPPTATPGGSRADPPPGDSHADPPARPNRWGRLVAALKGPTWGMQPAGGEGRTSTGADG